MLALVLGFVFSLRQSIPLGPVCIENCLHGEVEKDAHAQ